MEWRLSADTWADWWSHSSPTKPKDLPSDDTEWAPVRKPSWRCLWEWWEGSLSLSFLSPFAQPRKMLLCRETCRPKAMRGGNIIWKGWDPPNTSFLEKTKQNKTGYKVKSGGGAGYQSNAQSSLQKNVVSDGRGPAEAAIKKPHANISSWDFRIQQVHAVSKSVLEESKPSMKWEGYWRQHGGRIWASLVISPDDIPVGIWHYKAESMLHVELWSITGSP